MARLDLKVPSRRALRIACGPTPFHPRYPLLGFRVLFSIKNARSRLLDLVYGRSRLLSPLVLHSVGAILFFRMAKIDGDSML